VVDNYQKGTLASNLTSPGCGSSRNPGPPSNTARGHSLLRRGVVGGLRLGGFASMRESIIQAS